MKLLIQYFWFLLPIFWASGILSRKRKFHSRIESARIDEKEIRDFQLRSIASITIPSVLLGIAQFLGGYVNPLFIYVAPLSNPYALISWIIVFVTDGLFLYWLWFNEGAEKLSKFGALFGLSGKPVYFRVGCTLALAFLATMAIIVLAQRAAT